MLCIREYPLLHLFLISSECVQNGYGKFHILLYKFRNESIEEANHVICDEHLAIAIWACPYPYGRDSKLFRNKFCNLVRHALQDYGKASHPLQFQSLVEYLIRGISVFTLNPVASQLRYGLRR